MIVLRALFAAIPKLRAREALHAIRVGVIASGNLKQRDAERAIRDLEDEAELPRLRQPAADPVVLAQRLGIQVVRE
jgi:hypothetical protein